MCGILHRMIPRSKHVVIGMLIVLAALLGMLFARTATGTHPGFALVLDAASSTVVRVEALGDVTPDARREAARSMMLDKVRAH